RKAGVSSFHWGTGSGMAGIEIEEEVLRDGACDIASGRCVGVNGLNMRGLQMTAELQIDSPFRWSRRPTLIFYGAERKGQYKISVNGGAAVTFSGEQLEGGVALPLTP